MPIPQPWTLGALAQACDARLEGDGSLPIRGVGTLEGAQPGDITFLTNPLYRHLLAQTRATAVILGVTEQQATTLPRLVSSNPYLCYARVAQSLFPPKEKPPGVHPSAVIAASAQVAPTAAIGPNVTLGENVRVGEHCIIEAGCVLGDEVQLGAAVHLYPRVVIYDQCVIGARCILHAGVVIGADGFGMARGPEGWVKIPQVGRVLVGADVEIGANTTVDRGAIEDTVIEEGVKLDNQIQVAHNCRIGARTVIAGCTGISGSTHIGRDCRIGGGVGLVGHLQICDGVTVSGFSLITKSITEAGVYTSSIPSQPHRVWMETLANLRALPKWIKTLKALEREWHNRKENSV